MLQSAQEEENLEVLHIPTISLDLPVICLVNKAVNYRMKERKGPE